MAEACQNPRPDCKYAGTPNCIQTVHHLYYPASEYVGYIATHFRNLEDNKEILSRCDHDELHATERPPEQPSREFMAGFLLANEHKIGLSAVKRIRKELHNGKS